MADVDMAAVEADVARRRANPPPMPMDPEWYAQRNPGVPTSEQAQFDQGVADIGGGKPAKAIQVSFNVEGPDGAKYRVDGPEGMTEDMARQAVAREHYGWKPPRPKQPGEEPLGSHVAPGSHVDEHGDFVAPGMHYMDQNSGLMRTLAGLGVGTQEYVRKGLNKLGIGSDDSLSEWEDQNRPITDTTEGQVGRVAGNVAAALPLSEAALAASTAARAVPIAGRVLGSALTRAGVEGGLNSAILADKGEEGESALEGGLLAGALHLGGSALGRTVRGLVQKSGAAEDLEDIAKAQGKDLQIPITQAGDEEGDLLSRITQSIYKHALPLVPGVTGQLKGQARISANVLKQAIDDEYKQTVNAYQFNVPSTFKDDVIARIKAAMPNADKTTLEKIGQAAEDHMTRYASGGADIDGGNLLNVRNAIVKSGSNDVENAAAKHGAEAIDDIIDNQLSHGNNPSNLADLARYQRLGVPDPQSGLTLPESAKAIAKSSAAAPNSEGRILAYGGGLYSLFAHGMKLVTLPLVGSTNLLASKVAQRFVMGDTAAQKAITNLVKQHPEMMHKVQQILRLTATSMVGQSNGGPDTIQPNVNPGETPAAY